ncbi:alpha/beta fold hydrolase [Limibaculum sp. FT325]|uniref:alpha/beta fold hydrolase n=1 Tax=Thermohalobaculum sediminis TaxID=2939436 RepID=UPI0020BF36DB|nr:alpha/beta fold hydrolase [Limibaculum sediminis]MCL5776250.1 alpha/beta fold hydrolase [Limibaculum sediminis]
MTNGQPHQGLALRALGPLEVAFGDRPVEMPPSRKTRALLAFLALADRPFRRERLCEIFWELPDDPKGALRWSLSKIRRVLSVDGSERLAADRTMVALDARGLAIDRRELGQAAQEGFGALGLERLEAIAATLRGGFLEDLALPRCPDYEAWRIAEAAEAERLCSRLLMELISRLGDQPERALRHAVRLRSVTADVAEADRLIERLRAEAAGRGLAAAPRAPVPDAVPTPPTADAGAVRFCTAPDGVRLAWTAEGEGPPILRGPHWMTHLGYDRESPIWRPWIEALSRENRFVRFDQRCNGLSDRGVADISFERMVDDIGTVADAAGLDQFVLLGVSQSCAYAIAYALRHPERVRGLILCGGFPRGWRARGDPQEIERREAMHVLLRQGWGMDAPTFRQLFTAMFLPGATPEQASWYNELQRRAATPEDAERLSEMSGAIDVEELLGRVRVPTLVLHATGDRIALLASGRRLAERIPGAEFVELASSNHILMGDEPAFGRFVGACREFSARVFAGPGGERLQPAPAIPGPAPGHAPQRDVRREVTVLAADIVSPLQSFAQADPELMLLAARPVHDAARRVVAANRGTLLELSDSVVTAVFGAGEPTEVHGVLAARAALAMQAELRRNAPGTTRLRIALDTGEAIVGRDARGQVSLSGPPLRHARRLAEALRRPVIAASDRLRASVGGYVRLAPLEQDEHPGFARGQRTHEVLALNSALSRWHLRAHETLTRFVGREAEVQTLRQLWRHVIEGRGQVALVTAEPGIGKSRLGHEFLTGMAGEDCQIVEGGAFEFDRDAAYAVARRLLRSLLAIAEADDPAMARDKLERGLDRLGLDAALAVPLGFVLELPASEPDWEALPAEDRACQIADAMRRLVAHMARHVPLLVLIEDLHWIDDASRAVLDRLVEGVDRQRILMVMTCRAEFRHDWGARSAVHVMRLHPLSIEDADAFVLALVGEHPSVSILRRLLVERTDGTPLLIEETVRGLIEDGRIIGATGACVAPHPIVDIETSSSVEPVIAARIERLAPRERSVLQTASVLGRNVSRGLLAELSRIGETALDAALAALERAEFLFEVMSAAEREYTFKHALIQDVAYASLMRADRERLHAAAFDAIRRLHAGALGEHTEALAEHAYRAGLREDAARWLAEAGERAIERSAYGAAIVHLERAIAMMEGLAETPELVRLGIDVRTRLRLGFMATGDYATGVNRLKEARDLAARAGDANRQAEVLLHLSLLHSTFGRHEKAIRAADGAGEIARRHGMQRHAAEADLAAAQALLFRSDARAAISRLEGYFDCFVTDWRYDRFGFLVTRSVWYLGSLSQAHALLGDFGAAAREVEEAVAVARETRRPLDLYAAQFFRNMLDTMRGPGEAELARMAQAAEECLNRAPFPFSPMLMVTWGYAQTLSGRHAAAQQTLERALAAARSVNMLHFGNIARGLLATVRAARGDAGARDELLWAARRAEKDSDDWLRIRVLVALSRIEADPDEQVRHLEEAARIAAAGGYRPIEARILVRLARAIAPSDPARGEWLTGEAAALFGAMGLAEQAEALRGGLAAPPPAQVASALDDHAP